MQFDMHNEVGVLEVLHDGCASKLLDYGINEESIVVVQRRYMSSLSAWRKRQPKDPGPHLRLYLNVFVAVLAAIKVTALAVSLLLGRLKVTGVDRCSSQENGV